MRTLILVTPFFRTAFAQFKATLDWAVPTGSESTTQSVTLQQAMPEVLKSVNAPASIVADQEVSELKSKVRHLEEQLRLLEDECAEKEKEIALLRQPTSVPSSVQSPHDDILFTPPPMPDLSNDIQVTLTPPSSIDLDILSSISAPPVIEPVKDSPVVTIPNLEDDILSTDYPSLNSTPVSAVPMETMIPSPMISPTLDSFPVTSTNLPFALIWSESIKAIYNATTNVLETYQLFATLSIEKLNTSSIPVAPFYSFHVHVTGESAFSNMKLSPSAKQIENPSAPQGSMILKCKVSHDAISKGDILLCKCEMNSLQKNVPLRLNAKHKTNGQNLDILMQYALNPKLFSETDGLQKLSFLLQPLVSQGAIDAIEVQPAQHQANVTFSREQQYCEWSTKEAFVVPATAAESKLMLRLKSLQPLIPTAVPSPIRVCFDTCKSGAGAGKNLSGIAIDGCFGEQSSLYKEQFLGGLKYKLQNGIYEYHF